jgi:hypothetical protein
MHAFHIHIQTAPTWSHVLHVGKKEYPISKQTQKSNEKTKHSLRLKQSCGRIKIATPTPKEKSEFL